MKLRARHLHRCTRRNAFADHDQMAILEDEVSFPRFMWTTFAKGFNWVFATWARTIVVGLIALLIMMYASN